VLPGVTVTITEVRTNIAYSAVTNESGNYTFSNLKDGTYRVSGELSGFKRVVRDGVEVPVNSTVRVDMKLEVGAIEESVTVVGASPLLQTDRADTSRIIESVHLAEVPLGFNRNFQGMMVVVPGALRMQRPHSDFFNAQDSLSSNVNGQSRLANNVQIEGSTTTIGPAADHADSLGRGDRDGEHQHQRLRRGVRARRRRHHQRDAQVRAPTRSRAACSRSATTKRPTRPGTSRTPRRPATISERVHARRAAAAQQAVLLRRLPAHQRQRRPHDACDHPAGGVPQRRLQRVADQDLRSADRQRRRHGPHAVREQHHPADRISPIAKAILANVPAPNVAAAPAAELPVDYAR
jgi:hypothetical protein